MGMIGFPTDLVDDRGGIIWQEGPNQFRNSYGRYTYSVSVTRSAHRYRGAGGGLADLAAMAADYYSNIIERGMRAELADKCMAAHSRSKNAKRTCCVASFTLLQNPYTGRRRVHPDSPVGSVTFIAGDCQTAYEDDEKYGRMFPGEPRRDWLSRFIFGDGPVEQPEHYVDYYQICYERT